MFVHSHWISLNLKMSQSSESDTKLLWFFDEFIFRAAAEALHQTPFKKRQIIISVWIHPKANNISWGLVLLASLKKQKHRLNLSSIYSVNNTFICSTKGNNSYFMIELFFKSNIKMLFLFLFRVCSLLLLFFSVFCVTLFHVVIQFVCRRLSFRLLRLLVLPLLRLSNHQTVRSVSLSPPAGRVRLRPSHHDVHQGVAASALRHQSRTTRWRWDARLVVVSSR